MCEHCWQELGSPQHDTPTVRHAADLVHRLYEVEGQTTGGMLHIQLDDWNLDDACWSEPFADYLIDLHQRQPLSVERAIVRIFAGLSLRDRASALALASGYWTAEG